MDSSKVNISNEPSMSNIDSSMVSTRLNLSVGSSKPPEQFLQEPTLAFLESHSSHLRPSLASGIFVLSLAKAQLNSIGDLGHFEFLQICDLSSNFIESFDALISRCTRLIKLDLHSNRVRWNFRFDFKFGTNAFLRKDKSITRWRFVEIVNRNKSSLSSRQSFIVVRRCSIDVKCKHTWSSYFVRYTIELEEKLSTSCGQQYLVVKSSFNLFFFWSNFLLSFAFKALDWHVIADDEIIERTSFPQPYAAFSSVFKINLHVPTGKVEENYEKKTSKFSFCFLFFVQFSEFDLGRWT